MRGDPSILSGAFQVRQRSLSVDTTSVKIADAVANRISLRIVLEVLSAVGIVTAVSMSDPGSGLVGFQLGTRGAEVAIRYNEDGGLVTQEWFARAAAAGQRVGVFEVFFSPGQIRSELVQ